LNRRAIKTILINRAVPDPTRHFNYRWDEYLQDVVHVSTPVKPFDYDTLIQITPETYHVYVDENGYYGFAFPVNTGTQITVE
jgi:hypothetical protein